MSINLVVFLFAVAGLLTYLNWPRRGRDPIGVGAALTGMVGIILFLFYGVVHLAIIAFL